MESQNIEFGAVINFLTKEDANAKEIHRNMYRRDAVRQIKLLL